MGQQFKVPKAFFPVRDGVGDSERQEKLALLTRFADNRKNTPGPSALMRKGRLSIYGLSRTSDERVHKTVSARC